jgi:hypothetical protein
MTLVMMWAAVGCGADDTDAMSMDDFVAAYSTALCTASTETCPNDAPWLMGRTADECVGNLQATFDAAGCQFDAERAETCLATLQSAACADIVLGVVDDCYNVLTGTDSFCSVEGTVFSMSEAKGATYDFVVFDGSYDEAGGAEVVKGNSVFGYLSYWGWTGLHVATGDPASQMSVTTGFRGEDGNPIACTTATQWGVFSERNPWLYSAYGRGGSTVWVEEGIEDAFVYEDAWIDARVAEDYQSLRDVRWAGVVDWRMLTEGYDLYGYDWCDIAATAGDECIACADGAMLCIAFDIRVQQADRVDITIDTTYDPTADSACE